MQLLALETSCDETSAAVIVEGAVAGEAVSSQIQLHAEYGGVVPELATREHLRNLQPVVQRALSQAGIQPDELHAIAATQGPGLPPALMVGWKAAQSMSFALGVPLFGINHVRAHLYSPWFTKNSSGTDWGAFLPNIGLVVSGGHTFMAKILKPLEEQMIGTTQDDAAGECFDKCAKLLGLPYPGGPDIDRLAREGNPKAFEFARPMLNQSNDNFSFSGLKTSVRYFLEKNEAIAKDNARLPDLCASIQAAIVEVLVKKTVRATRRERLECVTVSGGVACNSGLREALRATCAKHELSLRIADARLCTDNASMIGLLAAKQIEQGQAPEPDTADIRPNWPITHT